MSATPPLRHRPGLHAQAYRPLTSAHAWWLKRLQAVLTPERETWFTRAVGVFFVVPFAPLTPMDLDYQTYLYEVFHRTRLSQVVHVLVFPLVNLALLVGLAGLWRGPAVGPVALDGATLFSAGLAGWYGLLALRARSPLWGALCVGAVAALWVVARALHGVALPALGAEGQLWASPWLWAAGLSIVIAASHALEPDLPPRVTGTDRWMSMEEFLRGPDRAGLPPRLLVERLGRLGAQILFGAFAELLAAQRLMPVAILHACWRVGLLVDLQPGVAEARRALAHGQPAIDYVGHGGGTMLHPEAAAA